MQLALTDAQCCQIIDQAIAGRPNEVCGLLGGRWQQEQGWVNAVVPLTNVAATPRIRYQIDQKAFVDAYHRIERRGDDLIGIYHSHPFGAAIPSPTDVAEATWPDAVYVIVGFPDGTTPDLRAWVLQRGAATPVDLVIVPDDGKT
ncbi:MAG: M67 family metallopeptidase [Aggregatilineales bacterium]